MKVNFSYWSIYLSLLMYYAILIFKSQQKTLNICLKLPNCIELSDKTFNDAWISKLKVELNQIQTLNLYQYTLSQQNLITLFSHPLPKINKISFKNSQNKNKRFDKYNKNALTPKIVQRIFLSSYFSQLKSLVMPHTYLQFKHFLFIQQSPKQINSNLQVFNLNQCFLQKRAFSLLSKINFNGKLKYLGISQSSLIQQETIDHILKIIKQPEGGKSKITNLTVFSSSINTNNMIKLLQNIQIQNLQHLNLGNNAFQHSIQFKTPFNNTFYEYLSKLNFKSLKALVFSGNDLDIEQLKYLKILRIPQLLELHLSQNFITDQYLKQWITKQNMPKLKYLNLNDNGLTDEGIKTLVQNKLQQLTGLQIKNNRRLTTKHLDYLSEMNSSSFKRLDLGDNSIHQYSLKKFFQNKPFPNLQQLKMQLNKEAFNLFSYLDWKSMVNLKYLYLYQSDFRESLDKIFQLNITFPKLKTIMIGGLWITQQEIDKFLNNLKKFGPELQQVRIYGNMANQMTTYLNISSLKIQNLPEDVYIQSDGIKVRKIPNLNKLQVLKFQFNDFFYKINFDYTFFEGEYTETNYFQNFKNNLTFIKKLVEELKKKIVFENIEIMEFTQSLEFGIFKQIFLPEGDNYYFEEYEKFINESIDFQRSINLPYLSIINYIYFMPNSLEQEKMYQPFLYFMNKMQMPHLKYIPINYQQSENISILANRLLKNNRNIKNLDFISCKLNCEVFQSIFKDVTLPYLLHLKLADNQIEVDCLNNIIKKHPLIKVLDISSNFIENGIFDIIIHQNHLILQELTISDIQIGNKEFTKFSLIQREFLGEFYAQTINVNSEGIKMLIQNTKQKLFPRCYFIDLAGNNINQQGVKTLLSTGIPFLKAIFFYQVTNPNLINNLLSYPNRLQQIVILDSDIYGISQNLDPRSTRHVQRMTLVSKSLILEDYKALSNLDFINLKLFQFKIQNIYECQILNYTLKIARNVQSLSIEIINQKAKGKSLDDSCLQMHDPNIIYMNFLLQFGFVWEEENAYIPKFYSYLYTKDQIIIDFWLGRAMIGDKILLNIIKNCNLEYMISVALQQNLLSDKSISQFFKISLENLLQLSLSKNQFTHQSVSHLVNKTFPKLTMIDLSMNDIGDEGVYYLSKVNFPKLEIIGLNNIKMGREGLNRLKDFNAPKLSVISIVNNDLNQNDLMEFAETFPFQNFPFLKIIGTSVQISSRIQEKMSYIVKKRSKEQTVISVDPHNFEFINKAKMQQN